MDYQRIEWPFPAGGLNTELHVNHTPPAFLTSAVNLYYPQPSMLRSRGGFRSLYAGGSDSVGCMYYWEADPAGPALYWAGNSGDLHRAGGSVASFGHRVTSIESFFVGSEPHLYAAVDNNASTIQVYDGASWTALTGDAVPTATKLMSRNGSLFATCDPNYPHRIYWCEPGVATNWAGAYQEGGWRDVAPGADGVIVDWIDYGDALYIFKQRGIYRLVGDQPANYYESKVASVDGIKWGTIADCGKGVLYSTLYGVNALGQSREGGSDNLAFSVESAITQHLSAARAAYSPQMNAYVVVNGTDTAWVSNIANRPDVWTTFTLPAAASCVYQGGGLYIGTTGGRVYYYDHNAAGDDAVQFAVSFKTGAWHLGTLLKEKNVRIVEGALNGAENATATVKLYADGSSSAVVTQAFTAAVDNIAASNFNCKRVALEIAYTSRSAPVLFGGVVVDIRPLGDRL